jgi:hypothetical protein
MFLQNVGTYLQDYTASQPRRPTSSLILSFIQNKYYAYVNIMSLSRDIRLSSHWLTSWGNLLPMAHTVYLFIAVVVVVVVVVLVTVVIVVVVQ